MAATSGDRCRRRGTTLTAVVLLVTVGLCLAHAVDDPGSDLCGSVALTTLAFLASAALLSAGRCAPARPLAYGFSPGEPPTLPPRA